MKHNLLIICGGSVATVKIPKLTLTLLDSKKFRLKIVLTKNALYFWERSKFYDPVNHEKIKKLEKSIVIMDDDEWDLWRSVGDDILHIDLRKWADFLIVCPASANLMAKISVGISDNLALSVIRAWDFNKPAIICPAMNTVMWEQKVTSRNIEVLKNDGWNFVYPISKKLACNETGIGALAELDTIVEKINEIASSLSYSSEDSKPVIMPGRAMGNRNTYGTSIIHSRSFHIFSAFILGIIFNILFICIFSKYSV
jgi:phosphopantothenoylcysteine decarboxylase